MSFESPGPSTDTATVDAPAATSARSHARWAWLRPLDWLDELAVPPWSPEGDASLAVRDADA